jgi:hypothetical protein
MCCVYSKTLIETLKKLLLLLWVYYVILCQQTRVEQFIYRYAATPLVELTKSFTDYFNILT